MPMPKPLPPADDPNLLQCRCDKDYALLEMCCKRLGIIGEEKKRLGKGHKAMGRAEREHIWKVLELTTEGPLESLIDLIQEESLIEPQE